MRIEFEISDESLAESNRRAQKDVESKGRFEVCPYYYVGKMLVEDDYGNMLAEDMEYELIDFIVGIDFALKEQEKSKGQYTVVAFVEDFGVMTMEIKDDLMILRWKFHSADDEWKFNFSEFKVKFYEATKKILARMLDFEGSEVLRKSNDEYFDDFLVRMGF